MKTLGRRTLDAFSETPPAFSILLKVGDEPRNVAIADFDAMATLVEKDGLCPLRVRDGLQLRVECHGADPPGESAGQNRMSAFTRYPLIPMGDIETDEQKTYARGSESLAKPVGRAAGDRRDLAIVDGVPDVERGDRRRRRGRRHGGGAFAVLDRVGAGTAREHVGADAAVDVVVTGVAVERVVAGVAVKGVVADVAEQFVSTAAAVNLVVARVAVDVGRLGDLGVDADRVVLVSAGDLIDLTWEVATVLEVAFTLATMLVPEV